MFPLSLDMGGGIPLPPFPISNLVKAHLGGTPLVSLVPPVSLRVGFPELCLSPLVLESDKPAPSAQLPRREPVPIVACLEVLGTQTFEQRRCEQRRNPPNRG